VSDTGTVGADGIIEWRDAEGRLDRARGPARVLPSGREEWFRHGRLHRANGPAVVHANGTEKWYREGLRHRDDGPAAIYPDGRRVWFVAGEKVREERCSAQGPMSETIAESGRRIRACDRFGS
jgi:hypothetical protein